MIEYRVREFPVDSGVKKVYVDGTNVGVIGSVGVMMVNRILTYSDYPATVWCFMPYSGNNAYFGRNEESVKQCLDSEYVQGVE